MQLNKEVVVVLGYPGCRKRQLASKLAKEKEYSVIDTGNLLSFKYQDQESQDLMKQGSWLPDERVNSLVQDQLQYVKDDKVMILGYPRNHNQLDHLQKYCSIKQFINIIPSKGVNVGENLKQLNTEQSEESISKKVELYHQQQNFSLSQVQSGKVVQVNENADDINRLQQQKYFFLMGPPCVGKTDLCKIIRQRTGYVWIDLREMQKHCDWMNHLIRTVQNHTEQNFIFEGFFNNSQEYELFKEFCGIPQQVFSIDRSKDYVYNLIKSDKRLNKKDIESIKQSYDNYMNNRQSLQQQLSKENILMQLQKGSECDKVLCFFNPKLYLTMSNSHPQLNEFCLSLFSKHNIISLDLSHYNSIQDLKKVLYMNRQNCKYLLTNLVGSQLTLSEIEAHINEISYLLDIATGSLPLNDSYLQVEYQQKGKTIKLDLNDVIKSVQVFEGHINKRNKYGLVLGCMGVGKSEVSKYLVNKFNFKLVDWESLTTQLKEKLGGDEGPLEELPFKEIIKHFENEFNNNNQFIIDNWNYTKEQLDQFIEVLGKPIWTINLKAEGNELQLAYKRKKEMEVEAELGEEDQAAIAENQKVVDNIVQVVEQFAANTFNTNFYNLNVKEGLQNTISSIQQIFMKRIITITNNGLSSGTINLLQNICYNHNLVLVDVSSLIEKQIDNELELFSKIQKEHKMKQSGKPIQFISQYSQQLIIEVIQNHLSSLIVSSRDIVIIGLPRQQIQLQPRSELFPRAIDEIICLQENIGELVQIVVFTQQSICDQYNDPMQGPIQKVEEVKPQQQDNPDEEEKKNDEDEEQKPKYDPSLYSWSIHDGCPKNVCQVFSKLNKIKMETLQGNINQNLTSVVEHFIDQHSKRLVQILP